MPTSLRLLRAAIQDRLDKRLPLTPRDRDRREAILEFASTHMALFGRPNLNFTRFAEAVRLSPGSVKRLFADLDALLAELLRRHLTRIARALGEIPANAPDRPAKLRAAYLDSTRKPLGGFTEAHLLLVRDRHLLPADELETIEALRDDIGHILGGDLAHATLDLLDAPSLTPAQIEFLILHLQAAPQLMPPSTENRLPTPPEPARMRLDHPKTPKHADNPLIIPPAIANGAARHNFPF